MTVSPKENDNERAQNAPPVGIKTLLDRYLCSERPNPFAWLSKVSEMCTRSEPDIKAESRQIEELFETVHLQLDVKVLKLKRVL